MSFIPQINMGKKALVVEGGAMRSVFSAGLLDGFLSLQFNPFDFYIGVSAGASNLATFLAGDPGKSLKIYSELALHKNFISYLRFSRGGHLLDLDWLTRMTCEQSLIDPHIVCRQSKPLIVCVTNINTGQPIYVKATADNLIRLIKASIALPLLYRDFPIVDGTPMTDGGIADGIPVAEAIRLGAKRIMVIRSRSKPYLKTDTLGHKFIRWRLRGYRELVATMQQRVQRHIDTIDLIRHPPDDVKILEVCPPETFKIGRFSRSREQLIKGYTTGFEQASQAIQEWIA